MAELQGVSEILRRATILNLRLYQSMVDLCLEYIRGLSGLFRSDSTPADPAARAGAGVLILEAEAGGTAKGAFLVTNDLDRSVELKMLVTPFSDSEGGTVTQQVELAPATVKLASGAKQIVTASANVGTNLREGLAYRGEIAIDGMKGCTVPIILRRQHSVAEAERRASAAPSRGTGGKGKSTKRTGGTTPRSLEP